MIDVQYKRIVQLLASNQRLFRALGDMARQEIVVLLACEDRLTVGEVAARTKLSRPAVSHHLRILKDAGLIAEKREGVRRYYYPAFRKGVDSMQQLVSEIATIKELL